MIDAEGPAGKPTVRLDSSTLQMLAHPLRSRLLIELRTSGEATATALAHRLDTNSGATSYHLRQLHEAGLVEEATGLAKGRERWWRAVHEYTSWVESDFDDDPDDRAAAEWLLGHYLRSTTQMVEGWMERRRDHSDEWRDAADLSDFQLELTPEGLRSLRDDLHAVIERHLATATPGSGTERVVVVVQAFPQFVESRSAP